MDVTIEAIGAEGDGLARHQGLRIVVPDAVPGERHRVRLGPPHRGTALAESLSCIEPRPRVEPACRHFGLCGGCVTQHVAPALEAEWKQTIVTRALRRRDLDAAVTLDHRSPIASRRRLRLAIATDRDVPRLGFRTRRSHDVVEVSMCSIARPTLVDTIAALRPLLVGLSTMPIEVELTDYAAGVEVVFRAAAAPTLADRERLAAWGEVEALARVGWRAGGEVEPVIVRRTPILSWPALHVHPPPGAFLQATAEGEAFLQASVVDALTGAGRVVDLYAGIGTLSAAARRAGAEVHAVEQNADAVTALRVAGVAAEVRDLDRRPLQADELDGVDAVILDPPRRGAEAQMAPLAASSVRQVVYVSCSPTSFARDAASLVAQGFELERAAVVDQFRFSAEVELIGRFRRENQP